MMHPVWSESEPERDQLMPYRIPLFVVGVFHTLLCAGTGGLQGGDVSHSHAGSRVRPSPHQDE